MSKGHMLRTLLIERLTAAADEIYELFGNTIKEYEEEVRRAKEEAKQKQRLLDYLCPRLQPNKTQQPLQTPSTSSNPDPGPELDQDNTMTPQIKEEPDEHSSKQEEEQLPVSVPESSVKTEEESTPLQQTEPKEESSEPQLHAETEEQPEDSSETDNDDDWDPPLKAEAGGDHANQVQTRDRSTAAEHTALQNKSEESTEEKTYSCCFCTETFSNIYVKNRHEKNHIGKSPPFNCTVCPRTFIHRNSLLSHMRTHTGEKPFTCSVCKKSFSDNRNYRNHVRIHTGERPYSCPFCHKTFVQKSHQNEHMRIHTGEKPFCCTVCNKSFTFRSSQKMHMRCHTGEKPLFSCPICLKQFRDERNYANHKRIHTGERPYSCPLCHKTFIQKSHQNKHMRVHIEENVRRETQHSEQKKNV